MIGFGPEVKQNVMVGSAWKSKMPISWQQESKGKKQKGVRFHYPH
jgi:hypothetical protein